MELEDLTDKTVEGQEFFINRTGIMLNPELGAELLEATKKTVPSSDGDGEGMRLERAEYLQEATPIGSYPALVRPQEVEEDAAASLDDNVAVLLDKLGERLAFERQGTRLYEAFIQKVEGLPMDDANTPEIDSLNHIRDEEREHFALLQRAIVELGGDATMVTPSADVAGVMSHGILQIVSDPRTTIAQSLQALLTAELADNDGWQMLQNLSDQLGHSDLAEQCGEALEQEQEHLENVRGWLSGMILSEAVGGFRQMESEAEGEEEEEKPKKKTNHQRAPTKSSSKRKRKK
jgi:rubrerythrin